MHNIYQVLHICTKLAINDLCIVTEINNCYIILFEGFILINVV